MVWFGSEWSNKRRTGVAVAFAYNNEFLVIWNLYAYKNTDVIYIMHTGLDWCVKFVDKKKKEKGDC